MISSDAQPLYNQGYAEANSPPASPAFAYQSESRVVTKTKKKGQMKQMVIHNEGDASNLMVQFAEKVKENEMERASRMQELVGLDALSFTDIQNMALSTSETEIAHLTEQVNRLNEENRKGEITLNSVHEKHNAVAERYY